MDNRKDKEYLSFYSCVAVITNCVRFAGSLLYLQSQQAGSKKWDSEDKPKENQKAFLEREMCVG